MGLRIESGHLYSARFNRKRRPSKKKWDNHRDFVNFVAVMCFMASCEGIEHQIVENVYQTYHKHVDCGEADVSACSPDPLSTVGSFEQLNALWIDEVLGGRTSLCVLFVLCIVFYTVETVTELIESVDGSRHSQSGKDVTVDFQ